MSGLRPEVRPDIELDLICTRGDSAIVGPAAHPWRYDHYTFLC